MTPDKVGRYKIKSEMGRGGMSTVYRAYDPSFDREVAVKVLPREMMHNLIFRARFKRELKMVASLEHPAIVPVYDVGDDEGQPYFVMRYMSGGSLADWLTKGALPLQDTAIIIERLASALDYAHRKGIVHRDIKPDNVLFDTNNNPCLTDFGIAKLTEAGISATGGGNVGTPAYVSPEQAQGGKVDSRSDVYGMGVIIYEMLTGKKPYDAETPMSMVVSHITQPIPDILQVKPDLPSEVDAIIKTAMAKDKEDRYPSAIELSHALNKVAFGSETTLPSSSTLLNRQKTSDSSRARTSLIAGGAVLLIVLAGLLGLRGRLPFLSPASNPTISLTPVSTGIQPTATSIPPTPTSVVEATPTPGPPTAIPFPGGADQIALLSGNDLYLMDMDGSNLILVRTGNFEKSDLQWIAGGRLVYISQTRNCAYILDSKTIATQEIVCFNVDEKLEGFRVSPDGKRVAISIDRTLNILPFDLDKFKTMDTRFNLLALKENCFYNQFPFRDVLWSKDGTQLAARVVDTERVSSDQIFLLNVDIPNCINVGPVRLDKIPGSHINFDVKSTKLVTSYDWDEEHLFLLNDSIRNDGFGDLYLYDSKTKVSKKINPINGSCCYRDARWSPDKTYILFLYQNAVESDVQLYYIPYSDIGTNRAWEPVIVPPDLFTSRDKPQPALRPVQ